MKRSITLNADEALLRAARERAIAEATTLDELFEQWLRRYTAQPSAVAEFERIMTQLAHVRAGRPFTREEMGERG